MKFLMNRANEKLAHIAGLELVLDKSSEEDEEAGTRMAHHPRPAARVCFPPHRFIVCLNAEAEATEGGATQKESKNSATATKYLLINKLEGLVTLPPSDANLVYLGFVETVLQLILQNQGGVAPAHRLDHSTPLFITLLRRRVPGACMKDTELFQNWLPKLGLRKEQLLPLHSQKVEEIVSKRMVNEAFLKRRKTKTVRCPRLHALSRTACSLLPLSAL